MSEKRSEGLMSVHALNPRAEMQVLVREAGGPMGPVKQRIARAARRLGIGFNRAKDLYYADPRCVVRADELDAARAAMLARKGAERDELREIAADFEALAQRMARLAASSGGESPDPFRLLAGRLRRLAHGG